MARASRGNSSVGDLIRSLVVLVGGIAVVAIGFDLLNDEEARLPDPVEYQPALEVARSEYGYDVLAPEPVPDGWRATSVDFGQEPSGDRWRLGFLTDDEEFVGLEQVDGEIATYRRDRLADFVADGDSDIDGVSWQRLVEGGDQPDRALVREDGGVLTIVRGTVSYEALEDFVALLR